MKKMLAFLILCLYFQTSFGQPGIVFKFPKNNQLEDSLLKIDVIVIPANQLSTVTANVSGREISLFTFIGHSTGTLSLAGLPEGPLNLQIVATDILNNQIIANQPIIYDVPPLLIIDSPLSWSAATPLLHIKARCVDSDGCWLNVSENLGNGFGAFVNFNFGNSLDTVLDLSAYNGTGGNLVFTASDAMGQSIGSTRQIFVDNSPYLRQVYSGNDQIIDFNYNKVLVTNPLPYGSDLSIPDMNPYLYRTRIVDIATGDSVGIPYSGPVNPFIYPGPPSLTPNGAIFATADSVTSINSIYDWNADSLYLLAPNQGLSLQANGIYATWMNDTLLYLRNLQTAGNTLVASSADENSVAANGVVAYMGTDYNIYRFANNSATLITNNDGNKWNSNPVTDGYNIVYSKTDPCCTPCCTVPAFSLHLNNGLSDTVLSNIGALESGRFVSYQLNNHYVAYSKQDTAGNLQIWRKNSSGTDTQVTFFGNDSKIDLLGPNGDLTFIRQSTAQVSRRYFASAFTGQISEIGSSLGQIFYRDSSWYTVLGRMLYRIDLKSIPNSVNNSDIPVDSSVYLVKPSDFIQNYMGYAALTDVMITALPARGILKLNGANVIVNTQIARDSLGLLTYIPYAGATGNDSLAWNGSNGKGYSSGSATIIFTINPRKPDLPVISLLQQGYCSNQGVRKIKLLNLPDTAAGVSVTAELDNHIEPLSSDSSFSFDVSSIAAGGHEVKIIYSNSIGSALLTDSFTIVAAETPHVKLSSSVTAVTGLSDPVVITATNEGGGGVAPLYSFASDRNITHVLQAEGAGNILTINPSQLAVGPNWIYCRMRTSDPCYTVQTSTDSAEVMRGTGTGIIDPDFPGQGIGISPNPFSQLITIDGLNISKVYFIAIHGALGERVYQQQVSNSTGLSIDASALQTGSYWLSIYDYKKNKLLGTMPVFKK
jgi:Secretion system C-terminal sorting domain